MEEENKKIPPRDIYMPKEELFKDYGVLDVDGKYPNPLNGKSFSDRYKSNITGKGFGIKTFYEQFTIWQQKEKFLKGIYENQVILVRSGLGSGKTLLLSKLALHTMNYNGIVCMTNPKRLPALKAADFAATTLDVKLGEEVGYNFKGAPKESHSDKSKLLFTTDGLITAILTGSDPLLTQFDMIILDEVHERNPNIDILLVLLRRALILRPTLKLMLVSATIDENIYKEFFPLSYFKFIFLDGGQTTTFPIDIYYLKKTINRLNNNGEIIGKKFVEAAAKKVCDILLSTNTGDILIFLTGSSDVKEVLSIIRIYLNSLSQEISNETFLIPLYSGIDETHEKLATDETYYKNNLYDAKEYDNTIPSTSRKLTRRVTSSTNIAESSLTISGLEYVVNAGISKQDKYYPNENIQALEKKYIAKSNNSQREGRVGRITRGAVSHLFSKQEYDKFRDYPIPPIINTNAAPLILDFMLLEQYISHIEFPITDKKIPVNLDIIKQEEKTTLNGFLNELLDIPHVDNLQQSVIRLYYLGLIKITDNKGYISSLGKFIGNIRMGSIELRRALISSYNYKCVHEVCAIASMLEVLGTKYMSVFTTTKPADIINLWKPETGEFILLLDIFNEFVSREYDQIFYENRRKIKIKKIGGTKYWCKKMKINYNKMVRVYAVFEDNFRSFNRLVRDEVELYLSENMYNTEENFLLYTDQKPQLYQDIRLNVIRALLDGFFVNIIKKSNSLTFTTLFPKNDIKGSLDPRQTLFTNIDDTNFKYCFYYSFDKVSLNQSFLLVNGIPKDVLRDVILDNDKYDIFKKGLTI